MIRYLRPPCGRQVRRMVALLTLAVGVPRLPIFDGETIYFALLRFFDPWVYGVMLTTLGVALWATVYRGWRMRPLGRLVAAVGFAAWVTLAAATDSVTSMLINLTVASVLLAEVWTMGPCDE